MSGINHYLIVTALKNKLVIYLKKPEEKKKGFKALASKTF